MAYGPNLQVLLVLQDSIQASGELTASQEALQALTGHTHFPDCRRGLESGTWVLIGAFRDNTGIHPNGSR